MCRCRSHRNGAMVNSLDLVALTHEQSGCDRVKRAQRVQKIKSETVGEEEGEERRSENQERREANPTVTSIYETSGLI